GAGRTFFSSSRSSSETSPRGGTPAAPALWTWGFELDTYYIPVGLGVGKVWASPKQTVNVFAERQWTVAHKGDGVPKLQLFAGLKLQSGCQRNSLSRGAWAS